MKHRPAVQAEGGPAMATSRRKLRRDFETCAAQLTALGDPCRLCIIACLFSGPKNVSELAALTETRIATVSHHLRVLREADLVVSEKHGRYVVYSLHPEVVASGTVIGEPNVINLGLARLSLFQSPILPPVRPPHF